MSPLADRGRSLRSVVAGIRRRLCSRANVLARPYGAFRVATDDGLARSFPVDVAETRRAARDVAVGTAVVGVVAVRRPRVVAFAAVCWVALAAVSSWRSRPGHGRRAGLPAGCLTGIPDAHLDQHRLTRCARRYGPVFKDDLGPSTPMVCVTGIERSRRLLADHEAGLVPIHFPFSRVISGGFVREVSGESHRRLRRVLAAALGADTVRRQDPALRAAARRVLERFVEESPCHPGPILESAVFDLWMKVFFGVAVDDFAALRELRRLYGIVDPLGPFQDLGPEADAVERLRGIVTADRRATSPGGADDVAHRPLIAAIEDAGHPAGDDAAIVDNLVFLAVTSAADVAALVTWIVAHLAAHPQWAANVRADVTDECSPAPLAGAVVSETLRLEQSEHATRRCVADDVTVDGYRVPKGWLLRACVRESHRDPAVFDRPDEFDPDRFVEHRFGPGEYAPFGLDRRHCLGEGLTRRTAEWFVTEMCRGYDATIVADGLPEFGRWRHWAPSPRLRIAWARRGDRMSSMSPAALSAER